MKNKVQLIGVYGSDEIISCSAWTSTSRDLSEEKRKRIPSMLNDLWKNGHETPFEKGIVHFLLDSEIASHIHLLKHRISSSNSESARYKELKEDKFYLPEDWKKVPIDNGHTVIHDYSRNGQPLFKNPTDWASILEEYTKMGNELYHSCISDLEPVLGRKRAKESARFFKTYNSQIECDIMFNMRSFANFQKLRNSPDAQVEIREIAEEMYRLVEETGQFKHTLQAWKNKDYELYLQLKNKFEG